MNNSGRASADCDCSLSLMRSSITNPPILGLNNEFEPEESKPYIATVSAVSSAETSAVEIAGDLYIALPTCFMIENELARLASISEILISTVYAMPEPLPAHASFPRYHIWVVRDMNGQMRVKSGRRVHLVDMERDSGREVRGVVKRRLGIEAQWAVFELDTANQWDTRKLIVHRDAYQQSWLDKIRLRYGIFVGPVVPADIRPFLIRHKACIGGVVGGRTGRDLVEAKLVRDE